MFGMRPAFVPIFVLGMFVVQTAIAFVIVYLAARLAIRHERK
jgi:hypothetical protein